MAVFRAPVAQEDHAERALHTALALVRRTAELFGETISPVFVGRDSETELLRAAYRRVARDGRPALVSVIGDTGVGKSALVRRFWDWLPSQQPEPLRRTGQFLSYGRAVTYRPLGDVLREQLGLLATDPPEVVRERLAGRRARP